jgi:hypothetical protein
MLFSYYFINQKIQPLVTGNSCFQRLLHSTRTAPQGFASTQQHWYICNKQVIFLM